MAKELPKRSEVNIEDTWDLTALFENEAAFDAAVEKVNGILDEISAYEGKVCDTAENLYECEKLSDEINVLFSRIYSYASKIYDTDTGDSKALARRSKIKTMYSSLMERMAFLSSEISDADEELLATFFERNKALALYKRDIELILRNRPHKLSKELEQLLAASYNVSSIPEDTYSVLDNADIEFGEVTDAKGEKVRITQGRYISLITSTDRRVREDAFRTYYASYKKLKNTYASLYYGQVKQLNFYAKARNYESNLESALFRKEIPVSVYQNLVDAVNQNLDKLHRYVSIRKKCLGLDNFRMYDIYPPMVKDAKIDYTYEEAKELVMKALKPLGEDYLKVVREAFDNRWIDVYENQNKRSGAYSSTVYGVHPYMLLNYDGKLEDVFTVIHEMGHSMHSYYSDEKQPSVYADYKIFVAEVASTCNEILLLKYMLSITTDKNEKAYLLNHYMDMFKATLFRQTQFAEFELETNRMVENGGALTADSLCKLYDEINRKYYGNDVEYDEEISYEWARIPHFYYNFYVYQYATSFCASVAIAEKILNDPSFVTKYIDFLSGGCSMSPIDLLKKVDVNVENPDYINTALKVMDEVMDEFEKMNS